MKKGTLPSLGVVAAIVIVLVSTAGFALTRVMAAKSPSAHIFPIRKTSLQNSARVAAARANANATNASAAAPVLTYYGGPVMAGTAHVYAIFWEPTSNVSANYNSLIQRYFNDVGGSPLYQNLKQYPQSDGTFPTNAVLAGSWVDTGAYPANPMLDSDIQTEVTHAQSVNGWSSSSSNVFFVFTEKNEGLCTDSGRTMCTPDIVVPPPPNGINFCGYHNEFSNTIYAAIPYAESPSFKGQCTALGTDVSATSGPNSNDADMTINVTSHEQMEAATDPLGNANPGWITSDGLEMADLCGWYFGPNNPQRGDVTWNNDNYIVQLEWDNAINSCTLSGDHTIRDYSIKNLHSNLVMDVFNGGKNAGAQVIQWGNKNGANQQWYLVPAPDSPFYQIVNRNSGLILDVFNGGKTPGANVIQWTNHYGLNQEWYLEPNGANDEIVNANSNQVMDVFNGGTNAGAHVIQWTYNNGANQQWSFTPVVYKIVNRNSNLVMDVYKGGTNAGENVIQWASDNGANQKWSLAPDGVINGTQVYQIVNLHSNLVMDVFNGGTTLGTDVIQWTNHNGPNQQWMLVPVGSYYQIVNVKSKLALDVYKGGKTLGVDVIQWTRTSGLNQQWSLVVTSP